MKRVFDRGMTTNCKNVETAIRRFVKRYAEELDACGIMAEYAADYFTEAIYYNKDMLSTPYEDGTMTVHIDCLDEDRWFLCMVLVLEENKEDKEVEEMRKEYQMTTKCKKAETAVRRFITKNNGFFGEHTAEIVETLNLMARTDIENFTCQREEDIIRYTVMDALGDGSTWYVDVVIKSVEDKGIEFTNDNNKVREFLTHDLEKETVTDTDTETETETETEALATIIEMNEPSRWSFRVKMKIDTMSSEEAGNVFYNNMVNVFFNKGLDTKYIYRVAGYVRDSFDYAEPVFIFDRYCYIKLEVLESNEYFVIEMSYMKLHGEKYINECGGHKIEYGCETFNTLSDFLLEDGFYIVGQNVYSDLYILRCDVTEDSSIEVGVDVTAWNKFTENYGNFIDSREYIHHYKVNNSNLIQCDLSMFEKKILHNPMFDAQVLYGDFNTTNLSKYNFGDKCKGAVLWVGDLCFIYGNLLFSIFKESFMRGVKMPSLSEIGCKGFDLKQLYKVCLELLYIFKNDYPELHDMERIVGGDYNG